MIIPKVLIILNLQSRVKEASSVDYQSVRASEPVTDKLLEENDFQIYLHFNKRNLQFSRN